MMNNKGFAVSAVLYTLLIAFLLFLGAALAMFSSSSSLVSNANNDLINGNRFAAQQVKGVFDGKMCMALGKKTDPTKQHYWYEGNTLVRINSRYGTMYWPRDFGLGVNSDGKLEGTYKDNKNVEVKCVLDDGTMTDCAGYDLSSEKAGEPEEPVVPDNPSFTQDMVTMPFENNNRIRMNDILGDDNGITCPYTSFLSISQDSYYATVNLIKNIELFESINNYDRPDLSIQNGEVSCFSGNVNYDGSGEDVCENNTDVSGFEDDFERFQAYLENVSPASEDTTYEYDRSTGIFTQKIKLGKLGYATIEYFPVIYKFSFYDYHIYETECNNDVFNTMVYYDLVSVNKFATSVDDQLIINGKDIDQLALYNNDERVGSYFFNSGEFDQATEGGSSSSTNPNPTPIPPVKKPKSWGNLYIRDKLSQNVINEGKFLLYDICE